MIIVFSRVNTMAYITHQYTVDIIPGNNTGIKICFNMGNIHVRVR